MNPMQLLAMLRNGANPQELAMNLLRGSMAETPMGKNLLSLAESGDAKGIEQIVRNMAQAQGIDFDKNFAEFKKTLGL